MTWVIQGLIRAYQRVLSPDQGFLSKFWRQPTCRYYPSCSQYASQAVGMHGVVRGSWLAVCRVCRCHPWSEGGFDPVPASRAK